MLCTWMGLFIVWRLTLVDWLHLSVYVDAPLNVNLSIFIAFLFTYNYCYGYFSVDSAHVTSNGQR